MGRHSEDVMRICVVAYLEDVRDKRRAIEVATERVREIEGTMAGLRSPALGPRSGGQGDAIPNGIAALDAARDRLAAVLADDQQAIDDAWAICSRGAGRLALWHHHVEGMTWAQVSLSMGFSRTRIHQMTAGAVPIIYRSMPEQWRTDPIPNAMPL